MTQPFDPIIHRFNEAPEDALFDSHEVARVLRRSYYWLSRNREAGPPFVRYRGGGVVYRAGAVRAWLRAREISSAA